VKRLILPRFTNTLKIVGVTHKLGGLVTLTAYLVALGGSATLKFTDLPKPDTSSVKDYIEDDFNDCWLYQWCTDSFM
jgi:hypothetical protein